MGQGADTEHPQAPKTPTPTWRAEGAASRTCCASLASVLTSRHCRSNSSRSPFPQQHSSAASRYWYRMLNCESLRPSFSSLLGTHGVRPASGSLPVWGQVGSGQAWGHQGSGRPQGPIRLGDMWGQASLRVTTGLWTCGARPSIGSPLVWGHMGSGQPQGHSQFGDT